MSYTIMIPARYASSRLPGKVLLPIQGKPILQHVYERACEAHADKIYILTDDDKVADLGKKIGANVIMTHPDCQSGTDRITEAVDILKLNDEVIVNVQADEPFIDAAYIDAVASALMERLSVPMATLAHEISDPAEILNPNAVKILLNHDQQALYFSRAAIPYIRDPKIEIPQGLYLRHIGLYAYRASFLKTLSLLPMAPIQMLESLEQLKVLWHGYPIHVEIVDRPQFGDINTREDYENICLSLPS
jgi:3-deoxy-manno-octulosonate cytidylyltransferase (CMP-KDO synthetase)